MLRLARLAVAPFEVAAAAAAILVGVAGLLGDGGGVVGVAAPSLALAWSAGYALAGILVMVGLGSGRRAVEVVGLTMLSCGVAAQLVAACILLGVLDGTLALLPRCAFGAAALVRVHTIVAGHEIVSVDARTLR